jgi:hypothetical protein
VSNAVETELTDLKASIVDRVLPNAPSNCRRSVVQAVRSADSPEALREVLEEAYVTHNWIEFRDTGCGMSRKDLLRAYLVIGTPSRRRELDATLATDSAEVPYLGEKGIGRLSAMRLGTRLHVRTATAEDRRWNLLDVDWSAFEDLDKLVGDIVIEPTVGPSKSDPTFSGTTVRITGLNASWSPRRIQDIATYELARLSDPFSKPSVGFASLSCLTASGSAYSGSIAQSYRYLSRRDTARSVPRGVAGRPELAPSGTGHSLCGCSARSSLRMRSRPCSS